MEINRVFLMVSVWEIVWPDGGGGTNDVVDPTRLVSTIVQKPRQHFGIL